MLDWATTRDDLQIYFEDTGGGDKPTLVFQSGFMGIHDIWTHQTGRLRDRYRCITHDNRGYGASDSPAESGFYTAENNAEDLKAVLDACRVAEPFLLVTHSMGSYIALEFTLRYPELVNGIIMMGGAAGPTHPNDRTPGDEDMYAQHHTSPSASMRFFRNFGLDESIAVEAAKWRNHVFRNQTVAALNYQPHRPLTDIEVPVLALHGTEDVISPIEIPRTLVNRLPNADLRLVDGANHFPQTEQPEQVNSIIEEFHRTIR